MEAAVDLVLPAALLAGGQSRLTRSLAVNARRLSLYLRLISSEDEITIPAAAAQRTKSLNLLPRRGCEAAVAQPATLKHGCCSRSTCCLDLEIAEGRSRPTCCLPMNARRPPPYLLPYCLNAAVDLPAASPWMRGGCRAACDLEAEVVLPAASSRIRGGCRLTCDLELISGRSRLTRNLAVDARRLSPSCDLEARRPKSSYLPPRRGCETAVALPATLKHGGRSRLNRRLAVDARRLSPSCDLEARRPKSSYLPPRRGCETAVALPATLKPGGRSRLNRRLAVDARRLSPTCRLGWRSPNAAVDLLAALLRMQDGSFLTC